MEKYTTDASSSSEDFENATLLNSQYTKKDGDRRRTYVWLTLANLFIFTLSMLSLICAVMSQKDNSGHSAAKLMDQFDMFCRYADDVVAAETNMLQHPPCTRLSTQTSSLSCPTLSTRQSTWASPTMSRMLGWM
jgi:hypothetical protein